LIPFKLAFSDSSLPPFIDQLEYLWDSLFFLDMIMNFNTPYPDVASQQFITSRTKIFLNYLTFWFWIDLFSSLPLDDMLALFVNNTNNVSSVRLIRTLRLIRLVKFARLIKLNKISEHLEQLNINPSILDVGKLNFAIFFMAHLIACFWFYLTTDDVTAYLSRPVDFTTWAISFNYADSSTVQQYTASFYWTVATMLAVGYGDIHATNNSERLYSIFTILAGGVMFGAVISEVTRVIETRNPQARAFKERMNEIVSYLSENNLSQELKTQAKVNYCNINRIS